MIFYFKRWKANIAEPGSKFEKVPNVIGIFISKFDMFAAGKTVYHIKRVISETGESQDNGLQEIYVNAKIDDGSDIAELMKIFSNQESYDFKKFPRVSERKRQFLKSKGGKSEMCEVVDNYVQEREIIKARETVKKLFENGVALEIVREAFDSLSDVEIKEIYDKHFAKRYRTSEESAAEFGGALKLDGEWNLLT